ncbi:MAG TPA: hypothetical protein VMN03_11445 [Burkholderiales bacterium]|nr:hypothetical protein [Burkholderiales bacterium]
MNTKWRWSLASGLVAAMAFGSSADAQIRRSDSGSVAPADSNRTVNCVIGDAACQQRARMRGVRFVITDSAGKPMTQPQIAAARRAAMRPGARRPAPPPVKSGPDWAGAPEPGARFALLSIMQDSYAWSHGWACGLTEDGRTLCWGGHLELGTPVPVPLLHVPRMKQLSVGGNTVSPLGQPFGCGLDAEGRAHCWGAKFGSIISTGLKKQGASPEEIMEPLRMPERPRPIAGSHRFTQLTKSLANACGLTGAGEVYCWAMGILAQKIAPGADDEYGLLEPIRLQFPGKVSRVAVGNGYIGGLVDGRFYRWGPRGALAIKGPALTMVSGGPVTACGLDQGGRAWCWGLDETGQLGRGVLSEDLCDGHRCAREFVPVAGDLRFKSISAGTYHSCALTDAGEAYCWGYNGYGQLGPDGGSMQCVVGASHETEQIMKQIGTPESRAKWEALRKPCSPRPVAVQGGHRFGEIVAGTMQTCALDAEGKAYCWGLIGGKDEKSSSSPVPVGG